MLKVLPTVKRFGTAIIGPQSEKIVSALANPARGLGGGVRFTPGAARMFGPFRLRAIVPTPEREASINFLPSEVNHGRNWYGRG